MDIETGEIIEVASYRTEAQQRAYQEHKKRESLISKSDAPFLFTQMDAIEGGLAKLNNKDLGYFLVMQTYIDYKNMLKVSADSKMPMTTLELQDVLKIKSDNTLRGLLKRLKDKGIVYQEKVELYGKSHKAYFISDEYCFRKGSGGANSKIKTDGAVKVFMDTLQAVYAQEEIQPADIGFMYKTIPFIHYDSNMLAVNPSEREYSQVKHLTIKDLADAVGLSREKTAIKLASIVWDNKFVFARIKTGYAKEYQIKVNPFVFYRKAGNPKTLGYEFYVTPDNVQ
ncbi:hypothetical protein JOC77_000549 [Peribacillus deserti]|uniref:MarR family transcriptional regulator n=1 Tax=Peribacillus deserti TaxID=673318 RepID=A0ABS2QEL2_9BACI|nr:hypothetical protein [Peribacillus deserti]MBM7691144.1 hypothetical protein [Peribacillus deserti]